MLVKFYMLDAGATAVLEWQNKGETVTLEKDIRVVEVRHMHSSYDWFVWLEDDFSPLDDSLRSELWETFNDTGEPDATFTFVLCVWDSETGVMRRATEPKSHIITFETTCKCDGQVCDM